MVGVVLYFPGKKNSGGKKNYISLNSNSFSDINEVFMNLTSQIDQLKSELNRVSKLTSNP